MICINDSKFTRLRQLFSTTRANFGKLLFFKGNVNGGVLFGGSFFLMVDAEVAVFTETFCI